MSAFFSAVPKPIVTSEVPKESVRHADQHGAICEGASTLLNKGKKFNAVLCNDSLMDLDAEKIILKRRFYT